MVLRKLSDGIYKLSKSWVVITSLTIMILFMVLVLPGQAQKSLEDIGVEESPDTSFFYSPKKLYQLAEEYGSDGRQAYIINRWTFDLIFPLVYVGFLATGISWFLKGNPSELVRLSNLIPILGGIFDYLENSAATIVMAAYPRPLIPIAVLSSGFTLIKWFFVYGSFLVYFIGLVFYLLSILKSKNNQI